MRAPAIFVLAALAACGRSQLRGESTRTDASASTDSEPDVAVRDVTISSTQMASTYYGCGPTDAPLATYTVWPSGATPAEACGITLAAGNLTLTIGGAPTPGTYAIGPAEGGYCTDATTCGSVRGTVTIDSTVGSIRGHYQVVVDATGASLVGTFVAPIACPSASCG
jgi:hypothetical protein